MSGTNIERYIKFAPENQAAADAFDAWQNEKLTALGGDIATTLVPFASRLGQAGDQQNRLWIDTNQNWVVALVFDGPFQFPYPGPEIPWPEGYEEMIALGVIVDSPDWYDWVNDPQDLQWFPQ